MSSFKKLKQINTRTKYTVFGYIHEMQSLLPTQNIPILISYLCLSYYYHNEYFALSSDQISISSDKMSIVKIAAHSNYENTTYCNTWIPSTSNKIAKWTFKIKLDQYGCCVGGPGIYICFISNEDINDTNKDINIYDTNDNIPNYGFNPSTCDMMLNDNNKATSVMKQGIDINKQFIIILNLKEKSIGFQYNSDQKIKNVIEKIVIRNDVKYKLAVNLYRKGCGISLVDFNLQ